MLKSKSATIPLCHLAQEQDGYLTERRDGAHRRAARAGTRRSARHGQLLRDVQTRAGRQVRHQRVHVDLVLSQRRRRAARARRGSASAPRPEARPTTACSRSRATSASPCTEAPCLQVNYRYFHKISNDEFDRLIDDLRAGSPHRHPAARHARAHPPAHRRRAVRRRGPSRRRAARLAPGHAGTAGSEPS